MSKSKRFGIVASRFNEEITRRLVKGALDRLGRSAKVDVVWVPGAFELSYAAVTLARSGKYKAIVALGCILEGETPHHRYLSQAAMSGLVLAGVLTGVPVTCGVVTAGSWKLAMERSQPKGLNRGREAAEAALELSK